jgi:quinol monooxygenase YgiN
MQELVTAMRDLPGLFGAQVCTVADAPEWLAIVSRWQDEASLRHIVGTSAARLVDDVAGLADEEEIENLISESGRIESCVRRTSAMTLYGRKQPLKLGICAVPVKTRSHI